MWEDDGPSPPFILPTFGRLGSFASDSKFSFCPSMPEWMLGDVSFVEETPGIWDPESGEVPDDGECKDGSRGATRKGITGCDEMMRILLPRYFGLW